MYSTLHEIQIVIVNQCLLNFMSCSTRGETFRKFLVSQVELLNWKAVDCPKFPDCGISEWPSLFSTDVCPEPSYLLQVKPCKVAGFTSLL